jgi:hypothetical protein
LPRLHRAGSLSLFDAERDVARFGEVWAGRLSRSSVRKRKRGRRLALLGLLWKEIFRGCPRRIGAHLGYAFHYRGEGALDPSPVLG